MIIQDLLEFKKKFNRDIFFDYNIKNLNWFNIGGKTKIFFKPKNLKELVNFLKLYSQRGKIFVLGAGSNTLFDDKTYEGVVIKLGSNFSKLSILNQNFVIAGAACLQKKMSKFAMENSIEGFEFMYCIPGSIGGGIRMNSGCFGKEFKDVISSIQYLDFDGNIRLISSPNIKFEYRKTILPKDIIFLSATFKGYLGNKNRISKLMENLTEKKEKSQPSKIKTGGSTFKNPIDQTDKKVWELIKECIPKNIQFGDASISDKHFNFFVNTNQAKSFEMKRLIKFVKEKVKSKTGVNLSLEIVLVE